MIALTACVIMLGLSNIGTVKVQAASTTIVKNFSYYLYEDVNPERQIYTMTSGKRTKITKLKNYNPEVVKVTAYDQNDDYGMAGTLNVQPLKTGIAKVTFRYAGRTLFTKL